MIYVEETQLSHFALHQKENGVHQLHHLGDVKKPKSGCTRHCNSVVGVVH